MKSIKQVSNFFLVLPLLLVACTSTTQLDSGNTQSEKEVLAAEAEAIRLQELRAQQEAERAEEFARQEAERKRELENQEARRLAEEARMAAEKEAAEREEQLRQARDLARQQRRVDELRGQVQAMEAETEKLEASNSVLNEALTAAEELSQALSEEREKFSNLDIETGVLADDVDSSRILELSEELERLREQAASIRP